jgi:hypothetical protein
LSSSYDQRLLAGDLTPTHDPDTLIGQTFFLPPPTDGKQDHAEIIDLVQHYEDDVTKNPEHVKFRLKINDSEIYENLVSYAQVLDYIENSKDHSDDTDKVWKFNPISGHQGPMRKGDPGYNCFQYNLQIEWANGETTYEPLAFIGKEDPISCATYAKEHGLLNTPGWKFLKRALNTKESIEQTVMTPIDWYSKKQSTIETATYGSEFMAARTATEHLLEPGWFFVGVGSTLEASANHSLLPNVLPRRNEK